MKTRNYDSHEEYLQFQRSNLSNLGEKNYLEDYKKQFDLLKNFLTPDKKCLVLGSSGSNIQALLDLGIENVTGVDLTEKKEDNFEIVAGDIHNLPFDDNEYDFVYINILDHAEDPNKVISEIERVLKVGGISYFQFKTGSQNNQYTEFVINNPIYDVLTSFDKSYCLLFRGIPKENTFKNLNFELVMTKDSDLTQLYEKYGNLQTIEVPTKYQEIWDVVNLPTQTQKLKTANITDPDRCETILSMLSKRAYFLTRLAEQYNCKNIAEVGTAQGYQFYSFAEYVQEVDGNVTSCDIRDARNPEYSKAHEESSNVNFVSGTSREMSEKVSSVDMFYIDGSHDKGAVLTDVANLSSTQSESPIWVFDDYDIRFGCFNDILQLSTAGLPFKVYHVGETASGSPSHQIFIKGKFNITVN